MIPASPNADTVAVTPSSGSGVSRPISPNLASARSNVAAPFRRIGDYDLESEIARGGMGIVYRARQLSLNRPVAFKMILSGQFASAADVERFHVEAEAAAGLDHPNIVPIYEVGSVEGSHFFTMKLIDGRSMSNDMGRLVKAPREGVRLLVSVCRAIHYAHQHGILHRDLKPANILIDARGEPHVTDFGLAKRTSGDSQLTQTGTIVGTPSYMAPEQAKPSHEPLTTAADIYSLGAILYEILTGRPPFKGDSPLDTLMLVVNKEAERPRSINAAADRDLETIALKCLEKDPARRYGSAEALAEDLDRWLNNEPILARPISGFERVTKWAKRRPAVAALAAAIAIITVLGVAGVVWQWREAVYQRGETAAALIAVAQEATAAETARDQEAAQRAAAESARTAEATQRQAAEEQRGIAVSALDQLGRVQYLNSVTLADREWSANNIGHVDQLLAASPAPFRNWEWHYLSRLAHMEAATLRSSGQGIVALTVNADGTQATAVAGDSTVTCWDLRTRQVIRSTKLEGNFGTDVAASSLAADGRTFAASIQRIENGTMSIEAAVWDAITGRRLWTLPGLSMTMIGYSAIALNRDGTRLVTASIDLNGAPLTPNVAAQLPQMLSGANARTKLRQWNAQTGAELPSSASYPGAISTLTLNPDATQAVLAALLVGTTPTVPLSAADPLRVIDLATGNVVGTLNHSSAGKPVYSADGRRIALGLPTGVRVWPATGGDELWTWTAKGASVTGFSADGQAIAAALADRSIHVLDAATGQDRARFTGSTAPVSAVFFTGSSSEFVSSDGANVRMFSMRAPVSAKVIAGAADTAFANAVTPDTRYLLLRDARGGLRTFELDRGREAYPPVAAAQTGPFTASPANTRVVFSRDGQRTVEAMTSVSMGNGFPQARSSALIRDVRTGQEIARFTPGGTFPGIATAMAAALDEHGTHLALAIMKIQLPAAGARPGEPVSNPAAMLTIAGSDVVVWGVPGQTPLATIPFPKAMVVNAELSPDGRLLAVLAGAFGEGNRAIAPKFEIYDVASGRRLYRFDAGREASPFMFSQSGTFFIGETAHNTVTIWDLAHADRPTVLPEHSGAVTLLALSPDETRLASVSPQGVTVFDVRSGSQLVVLHESEGPFSVRHVIAPGTAAAGTTSLRFSADGRQIIQTIVGSDPKGISVQFRTWDGSPR